MSKWISGKVLLGRWNIRPFELLEYVQKGLQPHTEFGKPIPRPDVSLNEKLLQNAEEQLDMLKWQHKDLSRPPEEWEDESVVPSFSYIPRHKRIYYAKIECEEKIKQTKKRIKWLKDELHSIKDPSWQHFSAPDSEEKLNIIIKSLVNSLYLLPFVERFEKEHLELLKENEQISEETVFPCKPGTRWEDITIILLADDMVRLKTPQGEGRFTYHQLGFADKRKSDAPTQLWDLLKAFAMVQGRIVRSEEAEYHPWLPDKTKRLNKHLQKVFGINERIYKSHYKVEKGYVTRFRILDHRKTGD
ncbi:MAG: hypothetical protein JSV96_16375 [Candidatus Aminicenantes bacterium]|nr:MAG: hypothetical protein JSV96_16375 [Candidatus Aminicenantes bacterium]